MARRGIDSDGVDPTTPGQLPVDIQDPLGTADGEPAGGRAMSALPKHYSGPTGYQTGYQTELTPDQIRPNPPLTCAYVVELRGLEPLTPTLPVSFRSDRSLAITGYNCL